MNVVVCCNLTKVLCILSSDLWLLILTLNLTPAIGLFNRSWWFGGVEIFSPWFRFCILEWRVYFPIRNLSRHQSSTVVKFCLFFRSVLPLLAVNSNEIICLSFVPDLSNNTCNNDIDRDQNSEKICQMKWNHPNVTWFLRGTKCQDGSRTMYWTPTVVIPGQKNTQWCSFLLARHTWLSGDMALWRHFLLQHPVNIIQSALEFLCQIAKALFLWRGFSRRTPSLLQK